MFYYSRKEKELNSKSYMLDMKSPIHRSSPVQPVVNSVSSPAAALTTNIADAWQTEHPFSHILRRELERSIRKHTRTGESVWLSALKLQKFLTQKTITHLHCSERLKC